MNFSLGKQDFEPIKNSVHTTECLVLGKTLLVRLYLKVNVYTNLRRCILSVHNLLSL